MDWPLKTLSRVSFLSGRPFVLGERVVCILFRGTEGLQRADLAEAEAAEWKPTGEIWGRWTREVENEDELARKRQALASAEEVFLALAQEAGGAGPEKETLLQMLALLLERKRLLRPLGRPAGGIQRYLHPRLQQEFSIAQHDLTAERVVQLQEQLHHLAS